MASTSFGAALASLLPVSAGAASPSPPAHRSAKRVGAPAAHAASTAAALPASARIGSRSPCTSLAPSTAHTSKPDKARSPSGEADERLPANKARGDEHERVNEDGASTSCAGLLERVHRHENASKLTRDGDQDPTQPQLTPAPQQRHQRRRQGEDDGEADDRASTSSNNTRQAQLPWGAGATRGSGLHVGPAHMAQNSPQSSCRLLWRGPLVVGLDVELHGIAIVAHLFTLTPKTAANARTTLSGGATATGSHSPFDDPFSPASAAAGSGADLCLGLEMLRNRALRAATAGLNGSVVPVRVRHVGRRGGTGEEDVLSSGGDKRKQARASASHSKRSSSNVGPLIDVETPADIRVYVDRRAGKTIDWLERFFCHSECHASERGLALDTADEQLVIFAQQPLPPPATDASTVRPPLTLLLGRQVKKETRRPRPDDPMPRENLFASKLRQTTSVPNLTQLQGVRSSKSTLTRSKTVGSGMLFKDPPPAPPAPSVESKGSSASASSNARKRRASSVDGSSTSTVSRLGQSEKSLAVPTSGSTGAGSKRARRESTVPPSPPQSLCGIQEEEELAETQPHEEGDSERGQEQADWRVDRARAGRALASAIAGVSSSRSGSSRVQASSKAGTAQSGARLKRAASLPAGSFKLGGDAPQLSQSQVSADGDGVESRNRTNMKKIVLASLEARGLGTQHADFKMLYSEVHRGLSFALRHKVAKERLVRGQITWIVDALLGLYLSTSLTPAPALTAAAAAESQDEVMMDLQ